MRRTATTVCDHGFPTVQIPADGISFPGWVIDHAGGCRHCKGQPASLPYAPTPLASGRAVCYVCGADTVGTLCGRHKGTLDGVL